MITSPLSVSFKGKYIIYGNRQDTDNFQEKMKMNKGKKFDDYYTLKFSNSDNTKITEIYATDKDAVTLKKSVENPEFKDKIRTFDRSARKKLLQIMDYVFGSKSDIRIHNAKDALEQSEKHLFDFKFGAMYGQASTLLDGSQEKLTKNGVGRTHIQKLKDGTIKEIYVYGKSTPVITLKHPDGTLEEYYGKEISKSINKQGQEVHYAHSDGKVWIRKIIEKDGTKKEFYSEGKLRHQTNPDGTELFYNEQGVLSSKKKDKIRIESYKKDGSRISNTDENGIYREYFKSGRIKFETDMNGNEISYHPNGAVKFKKEANGNFEQYLYFDVSKNKPQFYISNFNESKMYDETGSEINAKVTKKGDEINVIYNDGTQETYNEKGVLTSKTFVDGKIEEYYEDKTIKSIQLSDGTKKTWYIDGKINLDDDGNGNITEFYQDGRIKSQTYSDGSKIDYYSTDALKYGYWRHFVAADIETRVKSHEITKDGNEIFYDGYKEQIVKEIFADGTEKNYDKQGKLINIIKPDGTKGIYKYNADDELISIKFSNGEFHKFKNGKLYYVKEADGSIYRIYDDFKLKIEPTINVQQEKRDNQWIAAYRSLVTTLAWKMAENTRNAQAGAANGVLGFRELYEKEKEIRAYKNSITFSIPYEKEKPEEMTEEEKIKHKKFFKQSWNNAGTQEYSIAMLLSHQIFVKLVEKGIKNIEDKKLKDAINEWIKENPEKYQVLFE